MRWLKKIAKERGLRLDLIRERGKGSHATLYLGERLTVIKDRKKEIGPDYCAKCSTTWAWTSQTLNDPRIEQRSPHR